MTNRYRLRASHTHSNETRPRNWTSRLQLQRLEDRTVPSVADLIVTGAGAGGGPHVKLFDSQTGALKSELMAYNPQFTGGVRVALADVTGDGVADLITGPGPGGGPHVRVFDGVDYHVVREFMAFEPQFTGGVNVAAGDFDADGKADIVVTPDYGGGPVVRVFSGATGSLLTEFLSYDASFRGGTNVAVGDVTGDGKPDIVTGAGNDGAPHVKVFDGSRLSNPTVASQFFAYDLSFRGGVYVAAIASTSTKPGLVVTGAGIGGGPHVKAFDISNAVNPTLAASFMAYPIGFTGGVHVSTADVNGDGRGEILVGPGADTRIANTVGSELLIASASGAVIRTESVYGAGFNGGLFVGGTSYQPVAPPNVPQGTLYATPANEGSTSQATFTNVSGGSGGYWFSFDFDNDGNFDVSDSSSASATIPAAFLADGPGSRTIRGRIRDNSGASADFTATVSIANINPTIQLGSTFTGAPGVAVNFSAIVTDPSPADAAAGFTYTWNFGDGATSSVAAPSHAYAAPGSYVVTLQARDKDGGTSTATATVNIASNPPVGTLTAGSANEGGTGTVGFSNITGGSGGNKFSFDFDNNGTFEITDSTSASATVPASFLADGPGSRTIRGRIKDSSGSYSDYTATMTIANVPPTVQFAGTFGGAPGTGINFSVSVTDPSPTDTAAGFTYSWDFGDGTAPGTAASPNHVYATPGYYTASVTVRDKDGGSASTSTLVTVGATASSYIVTPYDKIPNFGANPTITASRSGSWSDAGTWSLGRLPGDGDIVSIGTNISVTYDVVSDVPVNTVAIQAGGTLSFRTDINTRLTAVTVLVMPGGTLQVGTAANPVAANVKAEIIIADQPFDLVLDPAQYGHGLIGLGTVTMHGAVKSDTFIRLAAEPLAGATTLQLSSPATGWRVGDRLVLPDTRQLVGSERWTGYSPQWETSNIASISADGRTITLAQPLTYDHVGARNPDGNLDFLPHVGNLTRNVSVRSQSNFGTRGYVYFTHRADVDVRYVAFQGLGRTTNAYDDNTTFDSAGQVTHVGTNQANRYPVTLGHLIGPTVAPANGYQYTFLGNAVTCMMNPQPFRWGISLLGTSYGLIQDNVVYNWAGAGIAVQDGASAYNLFKHNFVVGTRGDENPRYNNGLDGAAYWVRGFLNSFQDNVAASAIGTLQGIVAGSGFNLWSREASNDPTWVPLFRGADPSVANQTQYIDMQVTPILEFTGNEAYGAMATGLTLWRLGTDGYNARPVGQSVIRDFAAWHCWEEGFFGYPVQNVLFDGFTVRGQSRALNEFDGGGGFSTGDYWGGDITIRNADIQGMWWGVGGASNTPDSLTIEDSYFRNYSKNISIHNLGTPGSRAFTPQRTTTLRNIRFDPYPGAPTFSTIEMAFLHWNSGANYIQNDQVFVYDYNGVSGDNFQLYYLEQAPDYIVPQTTYYGPDNNSDGHPDWVDNLGSPEAGLTNSQNWATYGIAIAGAISPTTNTRANIKGFVLQS